MKNYKPEMEFLPAETSASLISKGFSEPCVGIYGGKYGIMFAGPVAFEKDHVYYKQHGAILIQQAEEWFLSRHGWSIETVSYTKRHKSKTVYFRFIVRKNGEEFLSLPPELGFKDRRKTRIEAIFHLLRYLPEGL
jgi:hypothetical protein